MALVGYILLVMILWVLRRRSVQEMEQQKKEQEKKYQAQLEEQNRKLDGSDSRKTDFSSVYA